MTTIIETAPPKVRWPSPDAVPNPDHPAKWSEPILERVQLLVDAEAARLGRKPRLLDPFAGVGRIHDLRRCETVGVEIEEEWAACRRGATFVGDATDLPDEWSEHFDLVVFSACYGNRMADHHNPKDDSSRHSYKFSLGHDPQPDSAATLRWDSLAYRDLHTRALAESRRVVRTGGAVVVNMSNHYRKFIPQPVVEWWIGAMAECGLLVEQVVPIPTRRMRKGRNGQLRYPYEHLIVTRRWT